jgi:hypothetical protein
VTLSSHPYEINLRTTGWEQRLVDDLRSYAAKGFPISTPLRDTDIPMNVDANGTSSLALPAWLATEDGWVLRSAHLLVGNRKRTTSWGAYLVVTPRLRSMSGYVDLGSYSSSSNDAVVGTPFALTGAQPVDRSIPKGSSLEVYVEQNAGSGAILTATDCTVSWVVARTGA